MNWRRMFYTGLVNSVIGVGLGLVLANIVKSPYKSGVYRHLTVIYIVIGGSGGFIVGGSWEGMRQLAEKCDLEEQQQQQSKLPPSQPEE